jgi:LacI family transcriptional regulator
VINHTRPVSNELRARVLEAMQVLGYRPNRLARGLRRGETHTLGLIASDISDPFFAEMARCIEDAGFEQGYSVILCNSDRRRDKELFYARLLAERQVDGILFGTLGTSTESVRLLQQRGIPLVVIDREISDVQVDRVLADNVQGATLATQHLLDLGHRRIACIAGNVKVAPFGDRLCGYRQALAEAGVAEDPALVVHGSVQQDQGRAAIRQLLSLKDGPTAVFASTDMLAISALQEAAEKDIPIPEALSVVGFDDIALAAMVVPALTTVAQPKQEMGRLATELLLSRIRDPDQPARKRELKTRLVIRESTRRADGRAP